jgi:adenosylcobinamide kinase / adenosylcobinamide-phosphate guanylyltransferase
MSVALTLILGGARSGKSAYAERLAATSRRPVLYLATATAGDEEMAARIAAHRAARPAGWRTVEAPEELVGAVAAHAREGEVVLVDCLTLWVSNVLLREIGEAADAVPFAVESALEARLCAETDRLLDRAKELGAALMLVSNEVGMGLVPPFPLGRVYRDALGRVNQTVARRADAVVLMVAGIPVDLRRLAPLLAIAEPAHRRGT